MVYAVTLTHYDDVFDTRKTSHLLSTGSSYKEVIEEITGFYGENSVEEINVKLISPQNFIEFADPNYFSTFVKQVEEDAIW